MLLNFDIIPTFLACGREKDFVCMCVLLNISFLPNLNFR